MKYVSFTKIVLSIALIITPTLFGCSAPMPQVVEETGLLSKVMAAFKVDKEGAKYLVYALERWNLSKPETDFILARGGKIKAACGDSMVALRRAHANVAYARAHKIACDVAVEVEVLARQRSQNIHDPIQSKQLIKEVLEARAKGSAVANEQMSPVNVAATNANKSAMYPELVEKIEQALGYSSNSANELASQLDQDHGDKAFLIVEKLADISADGDIPEDFMQEAIDFAYGIFDQARRRGITPERYRDIFRYAEKNCERGFDLKQLSAEGFTDFAAQVPQASRSNPNLFDGTKKDGTTSTDLLDDRVAKFKNHLLKRWYFYAGGAVAVGVIAGALIYYFKTNKKSSEKTSN